MESNPEKMTALDHLGMVLYPLADLHPGHRSRAFEEALAFYNKERPQGRIERTGACWTYIQHLGGELRPATIDKKTGEFFGHVTDEIMDNLEAKFLAGENIQ